MKLWHFDYFYFIALIFYPYRSQQVCEQLDHISYAFHIFCENFMIDDIKIFSNWPYNIYIEIRNWNSTEIGPHMFQSWQPLKQLTITSSKIKIIYNEAFDGLNLTYLDLHNNTIMYIDQISFNGLQKLITLDLSFNRISKIENGTFNGLNSLQKLFLNNNNITFLKKGIFASIEELDLGHNSISYFEKDTFYGLHKLNSLNLQHNRIGYLNESNFNGLENLVVLNLTNNNVVNIETNALNGLHNLKELDLSYNNISNIGKNTFSVLNSLNLLSLENNKIENISIDTFNNLYKLEYLYLSYNEISKLPNGCFKHLNELSYLDLSSNDILSLDSDIFIGLYNLRYLNLSHNQLTNLNQGIFHNIDKILTLDISYNKFIYIDVGNTLSRIVSRETDIYLEGNKWPCSLLTQIVTQNINLNIQQGSEHNATNIRGNYCTKEKPLIDKKFESNKSQDLNLTITTEVNHNHDDKLEQFQKHINTSSSRDQNTNLPNLEENLNTERVYKIIEERIDLIMEKSNRKLAIVEDLLIFISVLLTITVIIIVGEKCKRYCPLKFVRGGLGQSESEQQMDLMY